MGRSVSLAAASKRAGTFLRVPSTSLMVGEEEASFCAPAEEAERVTARMVLGGEGSFRRARMAALPCLPVAVVTRIGPDMVAVSVDGVLAVCSC